MQLAGLRVLVVDDNPTDRAVLMSYLASWGLQPETASSGAEALARLRSEQDPPALALIDMAMPEMDGFALARAT